MSKGRSTRTAVNLNRKQSDPELGAESSSSTPSEVDYGFSFALGLIFGLEWFGRPTPNESGSDPELETARWKGHRLLNGPSQTPSRHCRLDRQKLCWIKENALPNFISSLIFGTFLFVVDDGRMVNCDPRGLDDRRIDDGLEIGYYFRCSAGKGLATC